MVQRLLNINITNAKCEYNTTNAKLDYNNQKAECNSSTQKGEYDISYDQIQIRMDLTEINNSIGLKDVFTLTQENAQKWEQTAYEGIAKRVQFGDNLANPQGLSIGEYVANTSIKKVETNIAFLPEGDPKIWFEGGDLKINSTPDKINNNWNTHRKGEYNYSRYKFNYKLTQRPKCDIEYIGGPQYVTSGSVFDVNA